MPSAIPYRPLIAGFIFLVPAVVLAQLGPIVPECKGWECDACYLVLLAQNIINFLIAISVFIAVLLFVYAGFQMVTAAGDTGKISSAKKMFTTVAIGFIIVLAAWLIVDTIMKGLFNPSAFGGSFGPWNELTCDPMSSARTATSTSGGVVGGPAPTAGCPACTAIDPAIEISPRACDATTCTVDEALGSKLVQLNESLTAAGVSWRVTEAYPPTVSHSNACHSAGTCIDANFTSGTSPNVHHINAFIASAESAGLRAVYEVHTNAERDLYISSGVPASNIQAVSHITGKHFSVYNQ